MAHGVPCNTAALYKDAAMLAEQLAYHLDLLCRDADDSPETIIDVRRRFEALRSCAKLPQGRENRGQQLSDEHIAWAILSLVPRRPEAGGLHAIGLAKLCAVGGPSDTFGGVTTFLDALVEILRDREGKYRIVAVRMSLAGSGVNAKGLAVIYFDEGEERKQLAFVSSMAVSLLQPGAQFDADLRYASASKEIILNQLFFERLRRKIDYSRRFPRAPNGDGTEYDAEEAEQARWKRLGVTPQSRFLNVGVDNQVTWPKEETLIKFDRYKLVLMPKTKENVQSIHVDLHANRLSSEEAMTIINRFLSLLTWCDDQHAITQGGWSGSSVPVGVLKRDLAFTTSYQWWFDRKIPDSEEVRRALALYREARNAQQNSMVSYAVLNYYKIIELRHAGRGAELSKGWIEAQLPAIKEHTTCREDYDRLVQACGSEKPQDYLYVACRCAVAHSSRTPVSDPDDLDELRRLHNAADIMRLLARRYIEFELGYPEGRSDRAEDIDE